MKKLFCLLILAFNMAFAEQTVAKQTVAILPSDGILDAGENDLLTGKMREAALEVLPVNKFTVLTQDVVIQRLGGMESYYNQCSENSCIVSLGKEAKVDYVAQCRVGQVGKNFSITVEVYKVSSSGLLGTFSDMAENFNDILALVAKKGPDVFSSITKQNTVTVPDNKTSKPSTIPPVRKENISIAPSNYYEEEEDFTTGEIFGAALLNIIPGLGSYAIMDDFTDVAIQWGAISFGLILGLSHMSEIGGATLIMGGYVFGFARPFFYDKPKTEVKVISQQKKSGFNMAILPDKHGEPKTYLFYVRRF